MLPLYLKEEKESYHSEQDVQEINMGKIIEKIEEHGFLEESISILKVFFSRREAGTRIIWAYKA